jgi:uncharacterized protein YuzE
MKISYDSQVDAVYFRFTDKPRRVTTQRLTEDISVNFGPGGEVVGVEVLSAQEHLKFSGKKPVLEAVNLSLVAAVK